MAIEAYLKWQFRIKNEFGHNLGPWFELFRFWIDEVVKYGALCWEFDGFELGGPPFGELDTMVSKLVNRRRKCKTKKLSS